MAEVNNPKNLSFQIYRLNEKNQEKIIQYLKAQTNRQKTLEFQMLYFQERFGDVDIMDYEVQRKLFSDLSKLENSENPTEDVPVKREKSPVKATVPKEKNTINVKRNKELSNNVNMDDF